MDEDFKKLILASLKEHEELLAQLYEFNAKYQKTRANGADSFLNEIIQHTIESTESLKSTFEKVKDSFEESK